MIRNSDFFEYIDKYVNSEMLPEELNDFEAQIAVDSDLSDEINLHLEVEKAICEKDIADLRNHLNKITQNTIDASFNLGNKLDNPFHFNLAEECINGKTFTKIDIENLSKLGDSFPKIHLYQHQVAGKENIHQFYKEQQETDVSIVEDFEFNSSDEHLFTEIQAALEESDINELRSNLKQVGLSMPVYKYSLEDIENYIYNRMDDEFKIQFREELAISKSLASEVMLIEDVDKAISESDIMELRTNLNRIQYADIQTIANIEDIENYINNELTIEQIASFEAELATNSRLKEEIELIKNINKALSEDDIMRLRNNLQNVTSQIVSDKQIERAFAGKFNLKRIIASTVAASIIILLGFTGLLSRHQTTEQIYQKFYTKYEIAGTVRSANINEDKIFALALQRYENKDYSEAINLFGQVISHDPGNIASHFYSGISHQETGKYLNALKEYEMVISHQDNLFTEQAEWYTGLCLLQINDNKKAYRQFKKIAESNGFYKQKANDILKKIKFSD